MHWVVVTFIEPVGLCDVDYHSCFFFYYILNEDIRKYSRSTCTCVLASSLRPEISWETVSLNLRVVQGRGLGARLHVHVYDLFQSCKICDIIIITHTCNNFCK